MKAITKYKIFGINLIGLIIGSSLGVFILSIIVRVSFSVSNTYQIIKANTELEVSARILNNIFLRAFSANGYIENNPGSAGAGKPNFFGIDTSTTPNETKLYLWYSGGLPGSLLCSGQIATPPAVGANPNPPTFLRVSLSSAPKTKCKDAIVSDPLPPIVSPQQFYRFYLVATANVNTNNLSTDNIVNVEISSSNTNITATSPAYGNSRGVKLAILLRSAKPVFTTPRAVTFNIFNAETFSATDQYLYKLVVIQSPFFYTTLPGSTNVTKIQSCNFATDPNCAYGITANTNL